jgi:preprotein translocase subunit SecA
MLQGGVAELSDPYSRNHALGLAAAVRAIMGGPVHLLAVSAQRAAAVADAVAPALETLGITLGRVLPETTAQGRRVAYGASVVCSPCRELATDYLRDRLHLRHAGGRVTALLQRLSGDVARERLMLPGLHCAFVADADIAMLDDALMPVTLSADANASQSRLLYEQALELARALEAGNDFTIGASGAVLTVDGTARLAKLVTPLGGIWAAPRRREELMLTALDALHVLERDRDYRIERGRVIFPKPEEAEGEEDAASIDVLRRLLEIKEGCPESGRRDVLARMSLPRFFKRYLHLGGVCDDARGDERELWRLYGCRTVAVGEPGGALDIGARIMCSGSDKWRAVLQSARARTAAGGACVIAVRSPDEAQTALSVLVQEGVKPLVIRGTGDAGDQQALVHTRAAGSIVLVVFPAERAICGAATAGAPLHLIVAELRGSRREVAHLLKVFAPETCEMLLSFEDKAVEPFLSGIAPPAEELPPRAASRMAARLQRRAERAQSMARLDLLSRDDYLRDLLALTGTRE